ncbi:MAG: hypothetical protein AB7P21_04755 [Lautropia sp.]
MSVTVSDRATRAALASVALLFIVLAVAASFARDVPLPDGRDAPIQCLSYAPYRLDGETPFDPTAHVSRERLREDLSRLATRTRCIRTYSVRQGLEQVPEVARELGMQVLLGAWIGGDRAENAEELRIGLSLTHAYADTVRAFVVGNEVLLRRELPEAELAALLERAARESAVPVTYADVWEFWAEHPALAAHVAFVTVHILPYWEDHPVAIEEAVPHVVRIAERMRERFVGKDILIGETGWPSAGRTRDGARPGRVEQARFFREFSIAAHAHGLRYNFIEAFDQPWKRRLEGAMGGAWGVFDSQALPKFPATGPLAPDPLAVRALVAAALGAGAGLGSLGAWVGWQRRRALPRAVDDVPGASGEARIASVPARPAVAVVGVFAVAGLIGAAAVVDAAYLRIWMRDWSEWLAGVSVSLAGLGLGVLLACRLAGRAAIRPVAAPGDVADVRSRRVAEGLALAVLFGVAVMLTLLAFDPRYRGFPAALYAMPTAAVLLLRVGGWFAFADRPETRLLFCVVLLGGVAVLWIEGPGNAQAIGFVVLAWVYALATAGVAWARARMRASVTAESSAATAAGSAE